MARRSAGSIDALLALTTDCLSRDEYATARLEWLERAIGCDTSYVGAAEPDAPALQPVVSGAAVSYVAGCEARADRYWRDRLTLNGAALRSGGAVFDHDALSRSARERMPFYREVVGGLGIRAIAVSVLRAQGRSVGCLYLGRSSRGAKFGPELDRLRRALPVLALGKRLHDTPLLELTGSRAFAPALTPREAQVLELVAQGLSNEQVALRLGSSPRTVKNQVAAILAKAGATNRTELVYLATRTSVEPAPAPAAK